MLNLGKQSNEYIQTENCNFLFELWYKTDYNTFHRYRWRYGNAEWIIHVIEDAMEDWNFGGDSINAVECAVFVCGCCIHMGSLTPDMVDSIISQNKHE